MYRNQLGVYHLMIVSKFFESIDDFINLEISTPKARGNMAKFHMNPIALDQWSRQFFTSLETLHVYNKEDDHFNNETFYKKVIWYERNYNEMFLHQKRENEIYMNLTMNSNTARRLQKVPNGVRKLVYTDDYLTTSGILDDLVIPDSVTFIERYFFKDCNELTAITIPTHWKQKGNKIYIINPFLCSFDIPPSVKTINGKEVNIKEEVKEFDIPLYVTNVNDQCFRKCKFTKIVIPTTIKELPYRCFYECKQLKELIIPTSITKLGGDCFEYCSSLTSLNITTSVVEIGSYCFSFMTSLKEIELPSSATEFGRHLFLRCYSLTSITLHDNYNEVKNNDFRECTSLSCIVLPSTVTKIGKGAFEYCRSLTSINLDNIKEFGKSCFYKSGITKEKYPQLPEHCWESNGCVIN